MVSYGYEPSSCPCQFSSVQAYQLCRTDSAVAKDEVSLKQEGLKRGSLEEGLRQSSQEVPSKATEVAPFVYGAYECVCLCG